MACTGTIDTYKLGTRVYQPSVITSFAFSRPNGITHSPNLASNANTGRP